MSRRGRICMRREPHKQDSKVSECGCEEYYLLVGPILGDPFSLFLSSSAHLMNDVTRFLSIKHVAYASCSIINVQQSRLYMCLGFLWWGWALNRGMAQIFYLPSTTTCSMAWCKQSHSPIKALDAHVWWRVGGYELYVYKRAINEE